MRRMQKHARQDRDESEAKPLKRGLKTRTNQDDYNTRVR